MATYGWRKEHSLEEWLFEESYRFNFFQAVRLLEKLSPDRIPVGEGSDPRRAVVWFKGKTRLDFPASDIDKITHSDTPDLPPKMHVNFMSLAGSLGPLPQAYSEFLIERVWQNDTAMRDFLDIFNHRIISLLYRVQKTFRPGFDNKTAEEAPFSNTFFSCMGLGTPGLRDRMETRDRALLLYTGILAQQPRSMTGLETILKNYFQIPVKGKHILGRWITLEEDQLTRLGLSGRNQRLGVSTVLAKRVWDLQSKFRLKVGPLTFKEFIRLLPSGPGFVPLCELTGFYTGQEIDFDVQIILKPAEVPVSRLSAKNGPRLGWTSWLKTREFRKEDSQVIVSPNSLHR